MLRGQDIEALSSVFLGMHEIIHLSEQDIKDISIPVLAICGELDEERPCLEKMKGKVLNLSLNVIPNKGHMDVGEDPNYYTLIDQFLSKS